MPGLTLTRRKGEQIVVADVVVITIADLDRGKVMVNIQAPPDVRVDRMEVWQARQERAADREVPPIPPAPHKPVPIYYNPNPQST
jgi:carbon storage regulator CsrA